MTATPRTSSGSASSPDERSRRAADPRRRWPRLAVTAAVLLLSTTACTVPNFGFPNGITDQSDRVLNLWKGSAIASLAVGVFVWALIFWAVIVYRKRTDAIPQQVQYNIPVEVLYTVIPMVIVGALFYYTARDETEINKVSKNPDVRVLVTGFQWSWMFQYQDGSGNTIGQPIVGRADDERHAVPTLEVPTGKKVNFKLESQDVIHSFWIVDSLFKRDVIPGRTNQFEVTFNREGTFIGRCAELCGSYHDRMIFYVKVVSPDQFDRDMQQQQRPIGGSAQ